MTPPDDSYITLYSTDSFPTPVWLSCLSFILLTVAFVLAIVWFARVRNARALVLVFCCLLFAVARVPEFLAAAPITQRSSIAFQIGSLISRFTHWADLLATLLLASYILSRLRQTSNPGVNHQ